MTREPCGSERESNHVLQIWCNRLLHCGSEGIIVPPNARLRRRSGSGARGTFGTDTGFHALCFKVLPTMVEVIGLVAAVLTTGSFIPQVLKIIKTRDVSSISLFMYVIFTLGVFLWLVYGIMGAQMAVILANAVTLVLALLILGMKIRFG